jgi:hypothetical protein
MVCDTRGSQSLAMMCRCWMCDPHYLPAWLCHFIMDGLKLEDSLSIYQAVCKHRVLLAHPLDNWFGEGSGFKHRMHTTS